MYKKLHYQIILDNNKKIKSIEIIPLYINFCTKYNLMQTFFKSLTNVAILQLKGYNSELPEFYQSNKRQRSIAYYVAPLLAFLVIFYISMDDKDKPQSLDDLINSSGLKEMIKDSNLQKKLNSASNQTLLSQSQIDEKRKRKYS